MSFKWVLSFAFSATILNKLLVYPVCATCPAHLTYLDIITSISDEEYNS